MPSEIGFKLNRVFRATITPAEVGTGFLAIQLYSSPGNPIYVDGVHFGVVAAQADVAVVTYQAVRLVKNAQFQIGVAFGTTLGNANVEEFYADVALGVAGENVDFQSPLILEPGYLYTFLHEGPVVSGAPANNLVYYAEVRGRTVPDDRVEKMPVTLRSGIDDAVPEDSNAVVEAAIYPGGRKAGIC